MRRLALAVLAGILCVLSVSLLLHLFTLAWLELAHHLNPLSEEFDAAVRGYAAVFIASVVLMLVAILPVELLALWCRHR